jgi:hypothetical protein
LSSPRTPFLDSFRLATIRPRPLLLLPATPFEGHEGIGPTSRR